MKLGFDLDGCLAQFNVAFHALLTAKWGDRFPKGYDPSDPPVWEWPRHFGYTVEEETAVWEEVWGGRTFWLHLDTIPGEERTLHMLNAINVYDGHAVHFITNRKGQSAQYQSARWLMSHGFNHPSVIVERDKLPIIKALKLDAYIDDRIETANELAEEYQCGRLRTRIYLRATRHNTIDRHSGLIVVNSVWEMLEREELV